MSRFHSSLLLLLLLHFNAQVCAQVQSVLPTLTEQELTWLGERIYTNECNRQAQCLTSWNQGEDFPSLGIGHFIWYRAGQQEAFQETFPAVLAYMSSRGSQAPEWISTGLQEQPWPDRESFLAASNAAELTELRTYLQNTMSLQTAYIIERFSAGLEAILNTVPASERIQLQQKADNMVAQSGIQGLYALIDYVHFKGEGILASERYAGQGWGLLQVLQQMPAQSDAPLQAFVESANAVLERRVKNAPEQRNEQRWLNGWHNRLSTYLPQN